MTHTKINPKTGKLYYYKDDPEKCKKRAAKSQLTKMFVNGKYISKFHPLYRPGRYKGFTDAAFSSLKNYESSKEGQVYVLCNPAFPNWCKVGMAVDAHRIEILNFLKYLILMIEENLKLKHILF